MNLDRGSPQLFISHSNQDNVFVERLERAITFWGMRPWVDRRQLAGGQQWSEELRLAILASRALILVLTPAALRSPVVRQEYLLALQQGIPVIIARLKFTSVLPGELAQAPQADFTRRKLLGEDALFLLLDDVGIRPIMPERGLAVRSPIATILAAHHRLPPGWQHFAVPRRAYMAPIFINTALAFVILAVLFAPNQVLPPPVLDIAHQFIAFFDTSLLGSFFTFVALAGYFLIFGGALLYVAQVVFYIGFATRRISAEQVVLGPDGFTISLFSPSFRQIAFEPRRYSFQAIGSIRQQRTRLGFTHLHITGHDMAQYYDIRLPRRLGNTSGIAAAIGAAFAAYQALPAPSPSARVTSPPLPPQQPRAAMPSSVTPTRAPVFTAIAGPHDLALLTLISNNLFMRGLRLIESYQIPQAGYMLLPTRQGTEQSAFTLYVVSAATLSSPQAQGILADVQARNKVVIPILVKAGQPLPAALASLQWIDFTQQVDHHKSMADLLNALDQFGVPLEMPGIYVDGPLALARALHNRLPAGWRVFRPLADTRAIYGIYRRTTSVARATRGLMAAFFMVMVVLAAILFTQIDRDPVAIILTFGYAALMLFGVGMLAFFLSRRRWNANIYARMMSNYYLPETIILTPQGVVVHLIEPRARAFVDAVVPFALLHNIHKENAYYSVTRLSCIFKDGHHLHFTVPNYINDVALVGDQIIAAFTDYRRSQTTAG